MEYQLSNICTKYYWNQTTTVKILSLVVGWYTFLETQFNCKAMPEQIKLATKDDD